MTGPRSGARVRPGTGQEITGETPAARRPSRAADDGWGILSYLITGIFLWGGLGWLGDTLLGTAFLLPVGLLSGAALALYTIYLRYGQTPAAPGTPGKSPQAQEGRR